MRFARSMRSQNDAELARPVRFTAARLDLSEVGSSTGRGSECVEQLMQPSLETQAEMKLHCRGILRHWSRVMQPTSRGSEHQIVGAVGSRHRRSGRARRLLDATLLTLF